jgi:hypothetical protein
MPGRVRLDRRSLSSACCLNSSSRSVGTADQQRNIATILHPGFKPAGQLERRQIVTFFVEHDDPATRRQCIADTTLFSNASNCSRVFEPRGLGLDFGDAGREFARHPLEVLGAPFVNPPGLAMANGEHAQLHLPAACSTALRRWAGVVLPEFFEVVVLDARWVA